jgi:hypothetical protein
LQVTVIFTAGEERKRRRSWARRRQWRVEGTRRHCSSTVQAVLEVSLFNPWSFRVHAPPVEAVPVLFMQFQKRSSAIPGVLGSIL